MSTYIDSKGYVRFKDTHKYVHRWAAEKKLGRKLRPGEVVHHKDRNKRNNHPDNLHVFRTKPRMTGRIAMMRIDSVRRPVIKASALKKRTAVVWLFL